METTVMLSSEIEKNRVFTITHAQKIFNMQKRDKNPGWQLTDKNFELKNGVITYRNTGINKNSKGKKSTKQSNKA